ARCSRSRKPWRAQARRTERPPATARWASAACAHESYPPIRPTSSDEVMNDLLREQAPVTTAAWKEIDEEARRALKTLLAGRKLVDFVGPLGWSASAVVLGRLQALSPPPEEGVTLSARQTLPLIEMR